MYQNWVWCWPLVSRVMKCLVPNEVENFSTSCATFSIKRTLLNGIAWQYRQERRNNSPHTNSSVPLPILALPVQWGKVKESALHRGFLECATTCFGRYFLMLLRTAVLSKGQAVQRYYSFFRMLGAIHLTKGHISEDFNLQQHPCNSLKICWPVSLCSN